MCGIAGIYAYREYASPVSLEELIRIRDHMIQRGPDGSGLWTDHDKRIGLAHRRLAIIDLSDAGAQPMRTPDGRYTITFNGEIYNYRELRAELEREGVEFHSHSDTEVLLLLYRQRGSAMLRKLRGMYAFAIWDSAERRLFLARDPFGIKPLYYADDGGTFRFASQVKALIAGGRVASSLDRTAEIGYFIWGAVPEPLTIYRTVRALPAGTWLEVDGGRVGAPTRHYDIAEAFCIAEAAPRQALRRDDLLAGILDAFGESVAAHMVADVPVGLFLSAGIDSSLIARRACGATPEEIRAVTLAFYEYANSPLDEAPVASLVAHEFGLDHVIRYVSRDEFRDEREAILAAMDQPTTDGVNSYFVSKVTAEAGVKVALSGVGGDELLAGYASFVQIPKLVSRVSALPRPIRALGRLGRRIVSPFLSERFVSPKYAGLIEHGGSWEGAYLLRRSLHMPWEVPGGYTKQEIDAALEELSDLAKPNHEAIRRIENPQLKVSCLELTEYLRNQLVRDTDWGSMAHSLEVRVPFLDVPFLERVAGAVASAPRIDKVSLARHARAGLPGVIWDRRKTGFSVPVREWLSGLNDVRHRGLRGWSHVIASSFQFSELRFLALVTDAYGGIGGIAKFNRDLLGAIADDPRCRSVDVFPRVVRLQLETIPVNLRFHVGAAQGKVAYLVSVARAILATGRQSQIICGHINLVPLAWLLGVVMRCPVTLIVHGIDAWTAHSNALTRLLLSRTDRVVSVSSFTAERIQGWSGIPPSRFAILPNCVDLGKYSPRPPANYLVERYHLADRTVIMTVGRLVSRERFKGFDEIIDLMPALKERHPDLHYLIVGDGDDRARLVAKVKAMNLEHCVTFTGYIREEEKADHFSLARAYVMPSRGEGFGIVYLEALASGIPVLGSKVDGSRDALMGGRLGLLVDPASPQEIVEGVIQVLKRPVGSVPDELQYYTLSAFRERVQSQIVGAVAMESHT
ncbi:MAG: asparagine synthase (glutamine-hydrolyzing) [Sulfuritalea sp.]|nr:asparagine synthase (glutamine-hydrolyzing) [Sulfuritalea sp.]